MVNNKVDTSRRVLVVVGVVLMMGRVGGLSGSKKTTENSVKMVV